MRSTLFSFFMNIEQKSRKNNQKQAENPLHKGFFYGKISNVVIIHAGSICMRCGKPLVQSVEAFNAGVPQMIGGSTEITAESGFPLT